MRVMSPMARGDTRLALPLAQRRTSLAGGVLGLLSNGKPNARELLDLVFDRLNSSLGLRDAAHHEKHKEGSGSGSACPPRILDSLGSRAVAVITASGD